MVEVDAPPTRSARGARGRGVHHHVLGRRGDRRDPHGLDRVLVLGPRADRQSRRSVPGGDADRGAHGVRSIVRARRGQVVVLEVVGDEPGVLSADGREGIELPVGSRIRILAAPSPARLVSKEDAPELPPRVRDKFDLPGDPPVPRTPARCRGRPPRSDRAARAPHQQPRGDRRPRPRARVGTQRPHRGDGGRQDDGDGRAAAGLGRRGSAALVREDAQAARVQARFDAIDGAGDWAEDGEVILARSIARDGDRRPGSEVSSRRRRRSPSSAPGSSSTTDRVRRSACWRGRPDRLPRPVRQRCACGRARHLPRGLRATYERRYRARRAARSGAGP